MPWWVARIIIEFNSVMEDDQEVAIAKQEEVSLYKSLAPKALKGKSTRWVLSILTESDLSQIQKRVID